MIIQITNLNNTVLLSKKSISTCLKLYSSLSNSSRSHLTSNSLLLKSNQTIKTHYCLNNSYNKRFICISSPALLASLTNTLRNKKEEATQQQKGKPLASSIVESSDAHRKDQISTHVTGARKVKQAAKDVSYGTIVFIGGALLVAMFYYLFSELFSRESPSGIYNESSKICLEDFNV